MPPADPNRWHLIQPILDRALDLPAEQRSSWLDVACANDLSIRIEVEQLLEEDATTGGILDASPDPFLHLALDERDSGDEAGGRFIPGVILADRYRVVSLLGGGGMGDVYRADDLKLGQPVALKFLPSRLTEHSTLLAALVREARIARQVSHPNVCRVYDIGEANGHTFLTMEYIDGEDLRSLLRRIGQLPHQKALDIARQLCAGLQAAHELGVLHRDLKPANVMLDARGRARITDFGIAAVIGERVVAEAVAGTPAYMAPELLNGHPATARSDLYALGLVLYELFTGRRAFDVGNLEELRRLQENGTPIKPSALVDVDPRVERAILACIETDPELRPRSARAVTASLPGGDPIDAAAEAGETPSPELVAASGPEGSLSPGHAFGTLAAAVAMIGLLLLLADRASVLGWVQFPRGVDVLEDHARGMLQRLGHAATPVDRAMSVTPANVPFRLYVSKHDTSPSRWNVLREPGQWDVLFWYRQHHHVLMPWNPDGRVWTNDPAPQSGDAQILTDLRGRLIWLRVYPEDVEPPATTSGSPDWTALFREAGLDVATFQSVPPTRNPNVTADARAAWSGVAVNAGGYPVRVEAATYRGKAVYFEQVVPWDSYWDPATVPTQPPLNTPTMIMDRVLTGVCLIAMPVVTLTLVVRNWLTGRGDRGGALRLAVIVCGLRLTTWVLDAHHVASLSHEWVLFIIAAGKSLVDAVAAWALYLAIEPYARRLHPRFLVSWTRLLRGRLRDPLVGRDILAGITLSTITVLIWVQLPIILPHAFGLTSPTEPMFHPLGNLPFLYVLNPPPPQALLGGRHALAAVSAVGLSTLGIALTFLVVLLALRIVLRRLWLALIVFAPIIVAVNPVATLGYGPITILGSLAATLAFAWTLRFGLVGALAQWFGFLMWMNFPITANVDAPYFGTGLLGVAVILAVALYSALTVSRRRPAGLTTSREVLT